jgi:hypothetical protein
MPGLNRSDWTAVLVGGNHLANFLIGRLGGSFANNYPPDTAPADAIARMKDNEAYDVWVCWAAIMRARDNT